MPTNNSETCARLGGMFLVKWDSEGLGVSRPTSSVTSDKSLYLAEPYFSLSK